MKTLILIRHAKSSWDNAALSDFERPLSDRGYRDAPRMAKRLREKNLAPNLLLASPANRALTTAKIIAEGIDYPVEHIQTARSIYHAGEDELLSIVQQLPDSTDVVMLFGHNPGFTDFANSLTNSRLDNIPTCGIFSCRFDVGSWRNVNWGKGMVLFFDFPKNED
jgi:phosphohistidine phosphatase